MLLLYCFFCYNSIINLRFFSFFKAVAQLPVKYNTQRIAVEIMIFLLLKQTVCSHCQHLLNRGAAAVKLVTLCCIGRNKSVTQVS